MGFLAIIRSIEDLLYEIMTWLHFYPRTMWRVLRHPITMLRYSDHELGDAPADQYADTVSPPLFLMITILLSHAIELAAHVVIPKPTTAIAAQIVTSDQNLLLLRSILFAIYPLMFATARLRHERAAITRDTLRGPFFAQCFVAAPAALVLGVAAILARSHRIEVQIAGLVLSLASVGWFLWVETRWFKTRSRLSTGKAFGLAFRTWFKASLINGILSAAILGTSQ